MSNPSLFESNPGEPTSPQNSPAQNTDDLTTLLSSIKNERGEPKYKDVKTALEALRHSQEFIPSLKTEVDTLKVQMEAARAEAARVAELENTIRQLTQGDDARGNTPPAAELSQEKIAEIVRNTLQKTQTEAIQQTNVSTVVNQVQKIWGAEGEAKFYQKAAEAGLSRDEINDLAKRSPAAVFKILGVQDKPVDALGSASVSRVNTSGTAPNTETYLQPNKKSILFGATTQEIMEEAQAAKNMVEELHAQGKSIHDLTDPKVFFKTFQRK